MTLFRLFFQPYRFFAEREDRNPIPALVAVTALSLLSQIVVMSRPGLAVVVEQLYPERNGHGLALVFLGILLRTIMVLIGVLIWAAAFNLCLFFATKVSSFREVFTISCYAAYGSEAVKFLITLVVLTFSEFSRFPLRIATNATAFMNKDTAPRTLYYLASQFPRSCDTLVSHSGHNRIVEGVAGLRLQKATMVCLHASISPSWSRVLGAALVIRGGPSGGPSATAHRLSKLPLSQKVPPLDV